MASKSWDAYRDPYGSHRSLKSEFIASAQGSRSKSGVLPGLGNYSDTWITIALA